MYISTYVCVYFNIINASIYFLLAVTLLIFSFHVKKNCWRFTQLWYHLKIEINKILMLYYSLFMAIKTKIRSRCVSATLYTKYVLEMFVLVLFSFDFEVISPIHFIITDLSYDIADCIENFCHRIYCFFYPIVLFHHHHYYYDGEKSFFPKLCIHSINPFQYIHAHVQRKKEER